MRSSPTPRAAEYNSDSEAILRRAVFESNKKLVLKHNEEYARGTLSVELRAMHPPPRAPRTSVTASRAPACCLARVRAAMPWSFGCMHVCWLVARWYAGGTRSVRRRAPLPF